MIRLPRATVVRLIALCEIIGGIAGISLCLIFWPLSNYKNLSSLEISIFFAGLALCCFSIFAGFQLWRRSAIGLSLSIIIQCLQIPILYIGPVAYKFASNLIGLKFQVTVTPEECVLYTFGPEFASHFSVWRIIFAPPPAYIGISVLPLIFVFFLVNNYKQLIKAATDVVTTTNAAATNNDNGVATHDDISLER